MARRRPALQLEGDLLVAPAAGAAGFCRLSVRRRRRRDHQQRAHPDSKICPRPTPMASPPSRSVLPKPPSSTRPQEAQFFIRMTEAGGRAVERKFVLPVAPNAAMIGVKPLFQDKSVAEGDNANFDVAFVAPEGTSLARSGLALRAVEDRVALSMVPPGLILGLRAGEDDQARRRRRSRRSPPTSRRASASRRSPAAIGSTSRSTDADGPLTSSAVRRRLVFGRLGRHAGPAGNLDRQAAIRLRRHHGRHGQRAQRRQADGQCGRRSAAR